jgi:hypothetical protein
MRRRAACTDDNDELTTLIANVALWPDVTGGVGRCGGVERELECVCAGPGVEALLAAGVVESGFAASGGVAIVGVGSGVFSGSGGYDMIRS